MRKICMLKIKHSREKIRKTINEEIYHVHGLESSLLLSPPPPTDQQVQHNPNQNHK